MVNFLTSVFDFIIHLLTYWGILYLIAFVYFTYFDKKKKVEKAEPSFENPNVETRELPKNNPNDFYGMHKLRNDEKAFFKDIEEKEKILESGGQLGVNAAEALFLMRNNRHSNMVISEDGLLTIQQKIMNFQAPLAEGETPRVISHELPYYVARIEELQDGGFRQWFTPEHAASCGVKTIRFDAYGRSRGDPEMDEGDEKNKRGKPLGNDGHGQSAAEALLADISKKMSRQTEMLADVLVDRKLGELETETAIKPKQQKFNPKQKQPTPVALSENNNKNIVIVDEQNDDEYKDDIQKLEELCPPPDFFAIANDDTLNDFSENISSNGNGTEDDLEEPTVELEDHSASIKFEYVDYIRFVSIQANEDLFVDTVLKNVFSENGKGNIFIDFENSVLLVEKNYFSKAVKELLDGDDREMFDRDFFSKGAILIYDGVKISEMIQSMNFKNDFIGSGKNNSKVIFNHLLESTDVEGVCFSGWFLKMAIDQEFASDFISKNIRGNSVSIIASDVADVDKISKQFKNVKRFH